MAAGTALAACAGPRASSPPQGITEPAPGTEPGSPGDTGREAAPIDAAPAAAIQVSVATWNVQRFFDTVCDSRACGGSAYEALPTEAEFEARADAIHDALEVIDADVVLLQELESQAGLDALLARTGDRWPHGVIGETGGHGSVDVALLSAWPIEDVVLHADEPILKADGSETWFSRELLEVHLSEGGQRLIVLVAHFRSKVDDDPARRLAEAEASRSIALAAAGTNPDAAVVFGGDLNDVPGSPPLDALESGGALWRVASSLPEGSDWTYRYWGSPEAIDHLYLVVASAGAYQAGSAQVFRSASGFAGSDHAALSASLAVGP